MPISKPLGGPQPSSSSVPSQSPANSNYNAARPREPQHCTDTCNVVIFGECGAGKSSLVNLIAGKDIAVTSPDATGCTTAANEHTILIQNDTLKVKLFDTPGLDEGPQGTVPDKEARLILKTLLRSLTEQGDIHLIVYCVRGERVIPTLRRNYKFIRSQVEKKVPFVLVVTCLESYQPDMEEWWRLNEGTRTIISRLGMTFAGHACITTETGSMHMQRRALSYDAVCMLIEQCRLSNETVVHAGPSRGIIPSEMAASKKHTNIVLFGQARAGKSSLVNLIAGENIAETVNDLRPCTLRWCEYHIEFAGESYKVFDTVGLDEPQLGISQYLDAVENAYILIQDLERRGGIDLLLFCMRAGKLTTTLENNYRLFHEFLCERKVPVVIVITHLENEVGEMDAWWTRNSNIFRKRGVNVAGHACITAIKGNDPDRYEQSRTTIRNVVKNFTTDGQKKVWKGGDSTLVSLVQKLKVLVAGKGKPGLEKGMTMSRLTKRCGMAPDVAKQLADRIKNGMVA